MRWFNLGNAAFSTEEFAESLKRAAAAGAKASEGERLLVQINQRFLDNDFKAQLALAKQLVEKYPRSPRAWLALAGVQGGLNQFVEQRQSIAKAMALDANARGRATRDGQLPICSTSRATSRKPKSISARPSPRSGRGQLLVDARRRVSRHQSPRGSA